MVLPGNFDDTANESGAVWMSETKRRSPTRSRLPVSVSFEDLHLIGAGRGLQTQATGIAISGETPERGATVNVTRCWIEQFSNGAIVATDVNLNVSDSTLADNNNDYGDGGGGIFYDTNGDAASQVDFMTVSSSSIVR